MTEAYKSCGYRVVINTRVGVGAHNMRTQFVETSNDGDRDWGAHVREDEAPLDKVKMYFNLTTHFLNCLNCPVRNSTKSIISPW